MVYTIYKQYKNIKKDMQRIPLFREQWQMGDSSDLMMMIRQSTRIRAITIR